MNYKLPYVINDLAMTRPEYWATQYGAQSYWVARQATRIYTRTRLAEAQNWRCCWCGCRTNNLPNNKLQATMEHIHPKTYGGTDEYENLAMACYRCNSRRKATPAEEFLKIIETERKLDVAKHLRKNQKAGSRSIPREQLVFAS